MYRPSPVVSRKIRQYNHQFTKKKMIDSFLNKKSTHIKMDKLLLKDPEKNAITDPTIIKKMTVNHYKQIATPILQKQKTEKYKWWAEFISKIQIDPT
ncbi:15896_t:CDS:2 [Acaulospora morrowiae]|uniref:15896_t:CDS:1 n=1 Tax=Acaulospora morrowiae TaxID=94023 RepID=A0A9N9AV07_9GLOM|nr:15896_t:CDS:2 [Acaulospora morrowiae]